MSADFWAGYISGAIGIVVGNPLDVIKVRLQARGVEPSSVTPNGHGYGTMPGTVAARTHSSQISKLVTGAAAPIMGYGALNAILFMSYNRAETIMNQAMSTQGSLWATWLAGATGGLATWIVSAPTELIKCRTQLSTKPVSSWAVTKQIWRVDGLRGFYFGGLVTALRDSIGYGFYFWSYELATRYWPTAKPTDAQLGPSATITIAGDSAKILLCGGLAGVVTWASVFPLDVIKTRVQTQAWHPESGCKRSGALQITKEALREGGVRSLFRGLTVCSVRAFIVNAVQWATYEWIMREMGQSRQRQPLDSDGIAAPEY